MVHSDSILAIPLTGGPQKDIILPAYLRERTGRHSKRTRKSTSKFDFHHSAAVRPRDQAAL